MGKKKNSIHYLTSQNQGLSGLKNIWPVIMSGDLLSVLFSALCQWWADQYYWLRQIIDLRDTDKSWYFAITEFNNCFIIRSQSLFFFNEYRREAKRSAIFMQQQSQEGEKLGFIYSWTEYYLRPNKDGQHCTWADHYLKAVMCRSHGGLSAN